MPDPVVETTAVIGPGYTFGSVTDKISAIVQTTRTPRGWWIGFLISFGMVMMLTYADRLSAVAKGVGIWGINIPVAWGFAIVNFVWWIGIGHAGTLISAILLLLRQKWRTSINRFAEAMTLFAVCLRGLVSAVAPGPALALLLAVALSEHDGPLAAVPQPAGVGRVRRVDLRHRLAVVLVRRADSRPGDAARSARTTARAESSTAFWRWAGAARPGTGSAIETAYLLLAGLATPLVVSVHTVVSFDFAVAIVPGWHSTIFPPYFVAGAIFSGFAMVLTLAIPLRCFYGLQDFITLRHLDNMAKVMLATGLIVGYGYVIEAFMALVQRQSVRAVRRRSNRMIGPYAELVLDADRLQRAGAAVALVEPRAIQPDRRCSSFRSW